eukprot:6195382-Pleurochrysis_carterae.AAC.3
MGQLVTETLTFRLVVLNATSTFAAFRRCSRSWAHKSEIHLERDTCSSAEHRQYSSELYTGVVKGRLEV